jgi:hypothetical protein
MFDEIELAREFFERLTEIDAAIVMRAAAEACRFCGGRLHRGDYERKPRGGLVAIAAEAFTRRFSLCCGRDGCRHRATPPSAWTLARKDPPLLTKRNPPGRMGSVSEQGGVTVSPT